MRAQRTGTDAMKKPSPAAACAVTLSAIGILGWLDFISGYELNFFVFYFLPVIAAATLFRHYGAIATSLISTLTWALADWLSGHAYSASIYAVWNALIRLIAFVTVGLAFARIRDLLAREHEANEQLKRARTEISLLEGLMPICSQCKSIREKDGTWTKMEVYISARSGAQFSHSYCPECLAHALKEAVDGT